MNIASAGTPGTRQVLGVAIAGLVVLWIFSGLGSLRLAPPVMELIHDSLEFANIITGFIIFFIIWYGSNQDCGARLITISLVVVSASILDGAHTLIYPLLDSVSQADQSHLSAVYALFSRLFWSFGLLYAVCLPAYFNTYIHYRALLYSTLLLLTGLIANISLNSGVWSELPLNTPDHPVLYSLQYAPIFTDIVALFILRRNQNGGMLENFLQVALVFGLLTDISFAFDLQTAEQLNMSGHICKLFAGLFILRGVTLFVIRQPFEEMLRYKDEMEALATNNAKLYQESEQQRNLIEDTLAKIGSIISSQLNLKDTLDAIADMVADLMNARQSCIALLHKDQSSLQVAATYGINTPPSAIPLTNSIAGQVLEQKTVIYVHDLSVHPELFRPQLIFSNVRSLICAPLVNDQEIIGVIEAYSSEKGAFKDTDALLLKALGYQAGAATASAMMYEETKMRLNEEKFLYQITQSAASTIDTDTIISQCTSHVVQALNADAGLGLLTGENRGTLTVKAMTGIDCRPDTIDLSAYAKFTALIDALKPTPAPPDIFPLFSDSFEKGVLKQILVVPLSVDKRLLGVILVGWQRFVSPERLERLSFAALMAQQIALGLEKANLYGQVKAMALSDGLTGLANRRNFDMFLRTELRRAASLRRPLSLIMFDLDKFKSYNDTYGHLIGDKLLAQVGEIMRHNVRSIDFPARYGGEEFSIILPECGNSEAIAIAEKLRQIVETTQFPDNMATHTARITASLGVATYDPEIALSPPDMEKIISVADKALYQAKQQGRNRVVSAGVIE